MLQRHDRDGETLYAPDPLYERMQALRELLDENGPGELKELRDELQSGLVTLDRRERDLAAYRLGLVEEVISLTD